MLQSGEETERRCSVDDGIIIIIRRVRLWLLLLLPISEIFVGGVEKKSHQIGHFTLLIVMFAQCLCTLSQTEWIRCNVSQINRFVCVQKHYSLNRLCAS